jgi:alpha-ketoglutarate-dependent 2,4-dichlorophenoxyacetate dioxygenase
MAIRARPLHSVFVGEVTGVDLGQPIDAAMVAAIETAIHRHAVLVFPGQRITDEQQLAFSRHFGPLDDMRRTTVSDERPTLEQRAVREVVHA